MYSLLKVSRTFLTFTIMTMMILNLKVMQIVAEQPLPKILTSSAFVHGITIKILRLAIWLTNFRLCSRLTQSITQSHMLTVKNGKCVSRKSQTSCQTTTLLIATSLLKRMALIPQSQLASRELTYSPCHLNLSIIIAGPTEHRSLKATPRVFAALSE